MKRIYIGVKIEPFIKQRLQTNIAFGRSALSFKFKPNVIENLASIQNRFPKYKYKSS